MVGENELSSEVISLPDRWNFVYQENLLAGSRYYAVFQITDARQHNYTSSLIPMTNRNQSEIKLSPDLWSGEGFELTVSLRKDTSELERGLKLQVVLTNKNDVDRDFWIKDILLNGERQVEDQYVFYLAPHQTEIAEFFIPDTSLTGLTEVDSFSFSLISRDRGKEASQGKTEDHLLFLPENCILDDIVLPKTPLGFGTTEDVRFSLLEIEPSFDWGDDLRISVLVENRQDIAFSMKGNILVNDVLQLPISSVDEIPPHCSRVVRFTVFNCLSELAGTTIRLSEEDDYLTKYIFEHELIQRMGLSPIRSLTFLPNYDGARLEPGEMILILLEEPFVLQQAPVTNPLFGNVRLSGKVIKTFPLADGDLFHVDVTGVGTGDCGIILSFCLVNKSSYPLTIEMQDFLMNGREVSIHRNSSDSHLLAPGAVKYCDLIILESDDRYSGAAVKEIGLSFLCQEEKLNCTIHLPDNSSSPFGYFSGDLLNAESESGSEVP